jgi:hypothetical protein
VENAYRGAAADKLLMIRFGTERRFAVKPFFPLATNSPLDK